MHLTLFVPDLLWPEVDDAAAFDFPGAADLARFLFLSDASRSAMPLSASWESRLAALFGFTDEGAPLAALRAVGSGLPAVGTQLCTDPVNLDFMQQALVLSPIADDTFTDSDRHALLQSLNEEFAEEGYFSPCPIMLRLGHPANGHSSLRQPHPIFPIWRPAAAWPVAVSMRTKPANSK